MRGFMTPRGLPDNPRTARYILKDYVNGKLLYCHAPPGILQSDYHMHALKKPKICRADVKPTPQQKAAQPYQVRPDALDMKFFNVPKVSHVHVKGINKGGPPLASVKRHGGGPDGTPRQKNFKKKEKLRRRYAYLDE
ncbi:large subunit GTPase 1 [Halocaridina rubra]|uniref:Large subunit GTPase 1 n=1 Tax=Halocaridina rubra TaxID=373956 RepID=A0AAN8ZY81_HALRR